MSEGLADPAGHFICEYSTKAPPDAFGHKLLTGCGKVFENYIRNQFGVKNALSVHSGQMVAFKRTGNNPYSIECFLADTDQI